jgi:hypothetical protein
MMSLLQLLLSNLTCMEGVSMRLGVRLMQTIITAVWTRKCVIHTLQLIQISLVELWMKVLHCTSLLELQHTVIDIHLLRNYERVK